MLFIPPSFTATQPDDANVVLMLAHEKPSRDLSVSLENVATEFAWDEYLKSTTAPRGPFEPEAVERVRSIWRSISARGEHRGIPITQPTSEGAIQLAWDNGREYLEVEVLPHNGMNWYFRSRITNEVLGTDDEPVAELPAAFFERLEQIVRS